MDNDKYVYFFGGEASEGNGSMKTLLGGKGANLADMASIGLPVPPGFTITTEACAQYYTMGAGQLFATIKPQIDAALKTLQEMTGKNLGGANGTPLLVSVRSGAAVSMPGMMDTVLNLGLNDDTVKIMVEKTQNPRFVWDSYRRFIQMFGDVVMGMEHHDFEHELQSVKTAKGVALDTDLTTEDLQEVVAKYRALIKAKLGREFPNDPLEQLTQAIAAVFRSWNNPRAIKYRELNDIRGLAGTAVNVQTMVFGNSGNNSATGVAFTRDPSTGNNAYFYGEYLINAQGEDVVAGIRTPQQITTAGSKAWAASQGISEEDRAAKFPALEESMPVVFKQLDDIRVTLENHYKDMQDLEFTIEDGTLYMLQTRNGKRTAPAAVRIAIDLMKEGLIDEKTAVLRVEPQALDQLLHPVFNPVAEKKAHRISTGLPASPGVCCGKVVFSADDAEEWAKRGEKVVLCRIETSPEDISGMVSAQGILTTRGGMTSHAAVVARGMGKCCVSGAGDIAINYANKTLTVGDVTLKEGDWMSLNGSLGAVYNGQIETRDPHLDGPFADIMALADKYRTMGVRTNADTPRDTQVAVSFGAEGIGLCRTEHMFFEGERIVAFRRLILVAETVKRLREQLIFAEGDIKAKLEAQLAEPLAQYNKALDLLLPLQRNDFIGMFKNLDGRSCTVRLLDPPLHEFLPHDEAGQAEMSKVMGIPVEQIKKVVEELHEFNPMLGHRGCRLGISYPEVTAMQVRAICEAAAQVSGSKPEIMIPLVGSIGELRSQKTIIVETIAAVEKETNTDLGIKIGTMIEVPRAALTADQIAAEVDFFSFGTNDLTQTTCAFSRDDTGAIIRDYVSQGFYDYDPFAVLDQTGVGRLIKIAVDHAHSVKPEFKLGVCGEHGGEPRSVEFFHSLGLTYVSCSPYRVPIARLAAAQAAIEASK